VAFLIYRRKVTLPRMYLRRQPGAILSRSRPMTCYWLCTTQPTHLFAPRFRLWQAIFLARALRAFWDATFFELVCFFLTASPLPSRWRSSRLRLRLKRRPEQRHSAPVHIFDGPRPLRPGGFQVGRKGLLVRADRLSHGPRGRRLIGAGFGLLHNQYDI
jgi:hypothetical protein